jgi:hypothetical protein
VSAKAAVYRCWYDDPNGVRRHVDVPQHRGIASIREGIWLDIDWGFGLGEKCLYWLPPSRLVLVMKVEEPVTPEPRKRLRVVA